MAIVNTAFKKLFDGDIDLLLDTIKVMLLTNVHATNIDTQEFIDDVSANQVSATGYTAGGDTLATPTTVVDNTGDKCDFDAVDTTWTITGSMTAQYAVIYKDTGTPATSAIVAIIDFGSDKTATDGDFKIQWATQGILTMDQP